MENVLDNFTREVDSLVDYIDTQKKSNTLVSQLKKNTELSYLASEIQINTASNKIFNYNSYIISLYGIFERFIEDALEAYLTCLSEIASCYESLPENIRKNNINKSAELLLNLELPKNKSIEPSSIISELYEGLSDDKTSIVTDAFTQHKANFRCSVIKEFFQDAGVFIVHKKLKNYEPIASALEQTFGATANLKDDRIFETVNDIATRRNDVAHGVKNIDLLSPNIIIEHCTFIKYYGVSLTRLLEDELMEYQANNESIQIDKISVFQNTILCCNANEIELNTDSKIIVRRASKYPRFILANIEEIQIEGTSVESISLEQKVNVGIKLDTHITPRNDFFLLNA